MRLPLAFAVIGVSALAHGEPRRTQPAGVPRAREPQLTMPVSAIERIASLPTGLCPAPPVEPAALPVANGFDGKLALIVDRASTLVARITQFRGEIGGFVRLENVTSPEPAAPRVIVLGLRFGAAIALSAR